MATAEQIIEDIVSCADEADGGREDARDLCEQLVAVSTAAALARVAALEAALRRLHDLGEWKLRHGAWGSDEEVQDVFQQAAAALGVPPDSPGGTR